MPLIAVICVTLLSLPSWCEHMCICYRFDFCQDTKERRPSENLGQVLFGERIESSPYKVATLVFILPFLKYIHNLFTLLIVCVNYGIHFFFCLPVQIQ